MGPNYLKGEQNQIGGNSATCTCVVPLTLLVVLCLAFSQIGLFMPSLVLEVVE